MAGIAKSGNELHSEAEGRPKGDGVSRAGESFPPCPWGQPRSGGGWGTESFPRIEAEKSANRLTFNCFVAGEGLEPPTSGL